MSSQEEEEGIIMARYIGSKHKLCRKEGTALCGSEKCPVKRGKAAPGMHGAKRKRVSDFGIQLKEKQKLKGMYGVLERQFRRYYREAMRKKGRTSEELLRILELRLDNVIYRVGIGMSRPQARQLVRHGKVKVRGRVTDIPSFQVKKGDIIEFDKELKLSRGDVEVPSFLKYSKAGNKVTVLGLPQRDDLDFSIREQLIVEYYSR